MTELKTLAKSDPEFNRYLLGDFSKSHRALPVQSLNVSTVSETVTFNIVPISSIELPNFIWRWAQILKLKNFILLLFPIFILMVKNQLDQSSVTEAGLSGILMLANVLGCLCLLTAMNLRNDYRDHCSGLDRVHPDTGSRAIQLGWLSALQVKRLSWAFAFLGAVFGVASLWVHPKVIGIVVMALVLIGLMDGSYHHGLKFRWWTELLVFLLFGPLFTAGFQMGAGMDVDFETLFLGVVSGWLSVFVIHIRNFEAIMVNDKAGFSNSVQSLGFESSKKLLWLWWILLIASMNLYHWFFAHEVWLIGFFLVSLGMSWLMFKIIRSLKSPVSSNFRPSLRNAYQLNLILIGVWLLENLSYLLFREIG